MSSHPRLVADYDLLRNSKTSLKRIHTALEGMEDRSDDLQDIWGHPSITDKMDEFVGNWDHYREELTSNVEDLRQHVSDSLQTLEKQDADLKNATEKSGKNGGK